VYELGRHFNFDVSLFERMVQNRGQCITLGVQHRMAPAMAKLIVPTIYPNLANDESVLKRQEISGIPHRLFFIKHTQPEKQVIFVYIIFYLVEIFHFFTIATLTSYYILGL
jgi:hypothetical protein